MFRSTRTGTVFVTASNSDERSRTETDFLCDGTADDAEIQAAVDSLPSSGGMVVLSEGTFTLTSTISRSIANITIMGMGMGTRLVNNASTVLISDGAQAGWAFLEFDTDAGDVTASGTGVVSDYWLNGTRQGSAGAGNVTGDTASIDKELVRFNSTTGKIIESPNTDLSTTTATLSDNADLTLYDAVNNGNPILALGSSTNDRLGIQAIYDTGAQGLNWVQFITKVTSGTADKGEFRFYPDASLVVTIDDNGLEIKENGALDIGTSEILGQSGGNTTLKNINALDATTITTFNSALTAGDVVGDTASIDKELVRFNSTTGKIIESPRTDNSDVTATLSDAAQLIIYNAANDGNPGFTIGASATEYFKILPVYDTGTAVIDYISIFSVTGNAAADAGQMKFTVDGTIRFIINDAGIQLAPTGGLVDFIGELKFDERADHISTPGAGEGYLWVKSTSPSSLIYTDDDGLDTDVLVSGSGDVTGDTASIDKELVRFNSTTGKIIESPRTDNSTVTATLSDDADLTLYNSANSANPEFTIGADSLEHFRIIPIYVGGTGDLNYVNINSATASAVANRGEFRFHVDGTLRLTINDNGLKLQITDGIIDSIAELKFKERADHFSTPTGAEGYLWVKSDTPSALFYTDDEGTDTNLVAAGSGDVTGDTASIDKELVRFNSTTGKIIESPNTDLNTTTATLSDNADLTLYDAVNDGNPILALGAKSTESFEIKVNYASGTQVVEFVEFSSFTDDATANFGEFRFIIDSIHFVTFNDTGIQLVSGSILAFGADDIISDSAGTTSLLNINVIDSTTGASIEADIVHDNLQTPATIVNHDTTATGTNLTELTDASETTLHSHAGGSGDVVGDTASIDKELVRFNSTTGKIIESPRTDNANVTATLSDGADLTLYDSANDANPFILIGSSATERMGINPVYKGGTAEILRCDFFSDTGSADADAGEFRFTVDGTLQLTIDDGGIEIKASGSLSFGAVDILVDSAGSTTLQNIDTIDATTANSIEAAVSHTDLQNKTIVGHDTTATGTNLTELTDASETTLHSHAAGGGDVTGDTASIDKELVRFNSTTGKVIESPRTDLSTTTATLSDNADLTLYDNVNDGNPEIRLGSVDAEEFRIGVVYDTGATTLDFVQFVTDVVSTGADKGQYKFNVDGANIAEIDDGGINLISTFEYSINDALVLSATTLGGLVVNSSLTSVGTIATGVWNGTDVAVPDGGTGVGTFTDGGILIGATTGALEVTDAGTLGSATLADEFLHAKGSGNNPDYKGIEQTVAIVIENPVANDNITIRHFNHGATIQEVHSICTGGTSVTFNLYMDADRSVETTDVFTSDQVITAGTGMTRDTPNVSAIAADDILFIDLSAVSGTPTEFAVDIRYTTA